MYFLNATHGYRTIEMFMVNINKVKYFKLFAVPILVFKRKLFQFVITSKACKLLNN